MNISPFPDIGNTPRRIDKLPEIDLAVGQIRLKSIAYRKSHEELREWAN
jgi:hypothetical protein